VRPIICRRDQLAKAPVNGSANVLILKNRDEVHDIVRDHFWNIQPCLLFEIQKSSRNLNVDTVYIVNDNPAMPSIVQSCRIESEDAALLSRQAKRRHVEVSTLSSLYLKEKALEEEYPGIGFRDSVGGREAYVLGHRVAVWEVVDAYDEAKTTAKTASHFRWAPALVRCALAYANAYPNDIARQRQAEVGV
jgi:uncharacterized protein (DUF433 family)